MASKERQAEETRIRRILGITSFDLANLENYLVQNGHVPDSTDEQAVRDAVLAFRGLYVTFHLVCNLRSGSWTRSSQPAWIPIRLRA